MRYEKNIQNLHCLVAMLIFMAAVLSGCASKGATEDGSVEDTGTMQDIGIFAHSGEIGARIEEYLVPAPDKSLEELAEEAQKGHMMLTMPTMYKGGFLQYAMTPLYCQFFSLETKKWTTISMDEEYEKDGIVYDGIIMVSPSTDGKIYCRAYKQNEKGKIAESWLAPLENDYRVGKIGPDCTAMLDGVTEANIGLFLDSSGRGYLYQQYQNDFELRLLDENMQVQSMEKIPGIMGGMVENPVTAQMYWYGTDQEGNPVMGQPGGGESSVKRIPGFGKTEKEKEDKGTSSQGQQKPSGLYTQDFYAVYSEEGDLYVIDRTNAYLIGEQESRLVLNFKANGYALQELYGASSGPGRSFRLLVKLDGELTVLTVHPDFEGTLPVKQDIQLALSLSNIGLENTATVFNRRNTEYRITIIAPEDFQKVSDFKQKIQMEISAGRGPDLIGTNVMPGIDAYARNGYLECLDGCLDVSTVLPAALEEGKRGGKLYGIPYEFSLDFASYRRSDVGEKDFVTLEEFMRLVRSSGAKSVQKLAYAQDIVVKYALMDRSNKTYIDWEKGESHLTEQPFLELLKFAGQYGYQNDSGDLLEPEDYFAVGCGHGLVMSRFVNMKQIYEELNGEAAMLGYPGTEGGGIYLSAEMLCVNSNSNCKDGAVAFMNFLLTEEAQTRYAKYEDSSMGFATRGAFPVNGAALDAMMKYEKEQEEKEIKRAGAFYDGTPYAEDSFDQFRFLVQHARAVDEDMQVIMDIVYEELASYFNGDKTAEQMAEILDSRVQLCFDEK